MMLYSYIDNYILYAMIRQEQIIDKIREIKTMEIGTLCLMRKSATGREYYNLQSWVEGKNVSRYVSAAELVDTRRALTNHDLFRALIEEYVALVVEQTRATRSKRKKGADIDQP